MRPVKTPASSALPVQSGSRRSWQILLWLVWAFNSLFFLPQCLDRSLAPRFFLLSLILLAGLLLLGKTLREKAGWRLHLFDGLLLAWYGFNLASTGWAFSWSEAVFYSQKVLLLFATYWMVRQAFAFDEALTRKTLREATTLLTFVVCGVLLIQIALSAGRHGLDNEQLYNLDWFFFGNKSLTAEFLFFLLVFNVLFRSRTTTPEAGKSAGSALFWAQIALLLLLILLLQTRTVYLALAVGALVYFPVRAWMEPDFSAVFRRKILPAALIAGAVLVGLLALKGTGGTLAERLNPLNYLESATANERRFVWYKTDLLNADHYWLGVGNGSWKFWFPSKSIQGSYRLQEQNVVFTRVHNDYLEVRSEMGMLGAVLFCILFGAALLAAIWKMRQPDTVVSTRQDLLVLTTGLLGYCIIQYFDFPRERIEMQVVLAILLAGIVFHTRDLWTQLPGIPIGKFKNLFSGIVAAGLLFNLVSGWYRVKGETHAVRMVREQAKRNYQGVIAEAQAAESRFYEYNDVAVPFAWYEGIAYYQMGRMEQAVTAFERAYRLNPWSFQVINNYASALVKAGRYTEAVPLYEKVMAINPRYEDGKFNLAYTWYQAGNAQKALEWLDRVDTIPNPATEEQRRENAATRKRQDDFRKVIGSK